MLLVTSFFYLTNKEAAKAECLIIFLDNFIFLCTIHEKYDFKYLKNPTLNYSLLNSVQWCLYVYILFCDISWWKLIDRICFYQIFNTRVVSQGAPPLFFQFEPLCTWLSPNMITYMLDISYLFNNNTIKCIKAKIFPFNQK